MVLIVCCVFDFEKISRWTHGFSKHEHTHTRHTHTEQHMVVWLVWWCVCVCGVWTCEGSACDVLTSCFRAESPRSATGIALSGSCSTKFLLLFFELCFRSAQVGGKAPDTRRKIEFDEFLSREVVKRGKGCPLPLLWELRLALFLKKPSHSFDKSAVLVAHFVRFTYFAAFDGRFPWAVFV